MFLDDLARIMPTDQRSVPDGRHESSADEHRLRAIVERMADGVIIVDHDGVIRFANPAAERLFGRSSDDLVGTHLGFPTVAGESAEIDLVRPHGDAVSVELRVVESEWEGETAFLASLRDITDRRQAEERAAQLEQERAARARAEAASQAKSEFLSVMSHELRTPLNAIIGYAELLDLRAAGSLADDQRQQLIRIRDSAHHLLNLVNEVLDLAKGEAGRLALACGPAVTAEAVEASLALVQPAADARAIELSSVNDAGGHSSTYFGDEARVRQILVNLLTNAIKFTPAGGHITVAYGRADHPDVGLQQLPSACPCVYVRVSDTGIGIPPEQLTRIFDPFMQVQSGHTRTADGAGLGLTMSRQLARLMKGEITAQSELGKGSTFTLWLTAAEEDATHDRANAQRKPENDRLRGLAEIGVALQCGMQGVLAAAVGRFRDEGLTPTIGSLRFSQLANHLSSYVATLATTLMAIQDARGQPSGLVADGSEIMRMVAERHGTQRQPLGWTAPALGREWQLLSEELHRVIQDCSPTVAASGLAEAGMIIDRFVEQAKEASVRSFARAQAEEHR